MKMISAIALLSLTAVAAPAQDNAQTTRSFAMRGFDRIDMAGCDIASVRLGSGFAVQVQGRADNIANLRIDTIGSTLRIRRRDDSCNGHDRRVAIDITLPSLKAVDVSGAAELTLPAIAIARFDVGASGAAVLRMAALRGASARFDVSGASKVIVQDLQAEHVDLDLSGASDLRAEGEVRRLGVGGSGTSHADLRGLRTSDAKMSASGMARIRAVVLHQVEADASGMANIALEGPAQCSTSKSGMARITCGR